jgi:hypothetical protein
VIVFPTNNTVVVRDKVEVVGLFVRVAYRGVWGPFPGGGDGEVEVLARGVCSLTNMR